MKILKNKNLYVNGGYVSGSISVDVVGNNTIISVPPYSSFNFDGCIFLDGGKAYKDSMVKEENILESGSVHNGYQVILGSIGIYPTYVITKI